MTPDQLRQALGDCNGERDVTFALTGMDHDSCTLTVHNAMLVPDEPDHLVKLTDGKSIYVVDAERIAWMRIGLAKGGIQRQ